MSEALKWDGKNPIIKSCRWNDLNVFQGKPSVFDDAVQFDSKNPLVYHIHGEVDNPETMVLTEDDYLRFITGIHQRYDILFPAKVSMTISSNALMFIGYSLSDNLKRCMQFCLKLAMYVACTET